MPVGVRLGRNCIQETAERKNNTEKQGMLPGKFEKLLEMKQE